MKRILNVGDAPWWTGQGCSQYHNSVKHATISGLDDTWHFVLGGMPILTLFHTISYLCHFFWHFFQILWNELSFFFFFLDMNEICILNLWKKCLKVDTVQHYMLLFLQKTLMPLFTLWQHLERHYRNQRCSQYHFGVKHATISGLNDTWHHTPWCHTDFDTFSHFWPILTLFMTLFATFKKKAFFFVYKSNNNKRKCLEFATLFY